VPTTILGIETSCDETAAAVVDDALTVRSSVVVSSIALHERFGGVVPELAGRAQVDAVAPVVLEALEAAGLDRRAPGVAAVAVTRGPGLVGSLLVGVAAAKAMALAWGVPVVGVNHLEGHLVAARLEHADLELPVVTLLVSGGHTMLVAERVAGRFELLGATIDDAVGEAYDKVARYLGLGYPGGPAIDRLASAGDPTAFPFPRPMRDQGLDLSLSGLKTAVVRAADAAPERPVGDGPPASRRRSSTCSSRSAHEASRRWARAPSRSAAGSPPTRRCARAPARSRRRSGCAAPSRRSPTARTTPR